MTQISNINADKEFLDAMVNLAHWRDRQSGSEADKTPDKEPNGIAEYRKIVMSRLSGLQVGDVDPWMGRKIKVLVRKSTRYIVYLDEDLEIQWWWTQRLSKEADMSLIQANVVRLTGASAFLLDKDNDLHLGTFRSSKAWSWVRIKLIEGESGKKPISERANERAKQSAEQIRVLVAESMAMVLNGVGRAECEKVQAMAEQQILVAKDQLCRGIFFWQFVQAIVVLYALIVVAQKYGLAIWGANAPGDGWYLAAMSGVFGAFLFATARMRSLMLEPDSGLRGLRMEAYGRALIGAGAGILVYFAFEAGLIFKAAVDEKHHVPLKMFLCIASGWSERILPTLISRAEALVAGTKN